MEKAFETLIKNKNIKFEDRWYPVPVDSFRNGFIAMKGNAEGYHPLVDNLAYNLQYIQFLDKAIDELEVSSVIYTMLVKNYVITGIGIIEGVFSYIIKTNGWWKTNDEKVILNSYAQQITSKGVTLVVRTEISKKIDPYNDKMTFDEMIKCLKRHHAALKVDHLLYPQIDRIRELRNRVHLQKGDNPKDTDYNAFDHYVIKQMKDILYAVLCSPKVTEPNAISNYDFLKPD